MLTPTSHDKNRVAELERMAADPSGWREYIGVDTASETPEAIERHRAGFESRLKRERSLIAKAKGALGLMKGGAA